MNFSSEPAWIFKGNFREAYLVLVVVVDWKQPNSSPSPFLLQINQKDNEEENEEVEEEKGNVDDDY